MKIHALNSIIKIAAILSSLAIIWGSVAKPSGEAPPFAHFDKLVHFVAYALQGSLYIFSFPHKVKNVVAGLFCLGLAIELIQWPLVYRSFSLLDLLTNTVGIFVGVYLLKWLLDSRKTSGSN